MTSSDSTVQQPFSAPRNWRVTARHCVLYRVSAAFVRMTTDEEEDEDEKLESDVSRRAGLVTRFAVRACDASVQHAVHVQVIVRK